MARLCRCFTVECLAHGKSPSRCVTPRNITYVLHRNLARPAKKEPGLGGCRWNGWYQKRVMEIAEWLRRMREHRSPGPATTVATRAIGQSKDFIVLPIGDDLDVFAERLALLCHDHAWEGARRSYTFTARDGAEARVGVMHYTVQRAQVRKFAPPTQLAKIIEDSVRHASRLSCELGTLGRDAVREAWAAQDRMMTRLQAENRDLRKEIEGLRLRLKALESGA